MRRWPRGWRFCLAAMVLFLAAGCAVKSNFVYKPGPAAAGAAKLPVKVAVLPFKDGTEDFTKRGSVFAPETLTYNLAKSGIGGTITALTPDLWAKSFADELTAAGAFRSVRFVYSPSELVDEDIYIEGTVEKAYASGAWSVPSEYALALRALRRTDKSLLWEKEVTRLWKTSPEINKGCGVGIQCMVDRLHADTNRMMQGMFAEARTDLVRTIGSPPGSGTEGEGLRSVPPAGGEATGPETARPPAPESVEQTIDRILKEK